MLYVKRTKMKGRLIKTGDSYYLFNGERRVNAIASNREDWVGDKKLSLSNCIEIENDYNLDQLAIDCLERNERTVPHIWLSHIEPFKQGFLKALELLSDKKFTEDNIIDAVMLGCCFEDPGIENVRNYDDLKKLAIARNTITEWEVEIEMEEDHIMIGGVNDVMGSSSKMQNYKRGLPKLDKNGCLILKRI